MLRDAIRLTVEPHFKGYAIAIGDDDGPFMILEGTERATRAECEALIASGAVELPGGGL